MARLQSTTRDQVVELPRSCLAGREKTCQPRLESPRASWHHAKFRWEGTHWSVQDISSNGTWLNGQALAEGARQRLHAHDRLRFHDPDEEWEVLDTAPPKDLLIPLAGGPTVVIPPLLPLPSASDPDVTIFRDHAGFLHLERAGETELLADQQIVDARGIGFRVELAGTGSTQLEGRCRLEEVELVFRASMNREDISVDFLLPRRKETLSGLAYLDMLLRLAEERNRDALSTALPSAEQGWMHSSELCNELWYEPKPPRNEPGGAEKPAAKQELDGPELERMYGQLLNRHVYLLRQKTLALGIADGMKIVERRRNGTLRVGVARFKLPD